MAKTSAPYTPMMMQYLRIKAQHPEMLIFFRLGDFYELFFEDAQIASRELSLVLTGKNAGQPERVPMCGVPYHAYKSYVQKLIHRGYKVGIVEQLEAASAAKGLVDRDITQIYTPGSFIDAGQSDHNFLVSVSEDVERYVIVYADVTTGDIWLDEVQHQPELLIGYFHKLQSREVVLSASLAASLQPLFSQHQIYVSTHEGVEYPATNEPLSAVEQATYLRLMNYVMSTQKKPLDFFKPLQRIQSQAILKLDAVSLTNLEVLTSIKTGGTEGTLYGLLNETKTPMGSRLLKQWLLRPSTHVLTIQHRLDFVQVCLQEFFSLESLRSVLSELYDIPRIIGRLHFLQANARDLLSLKKSLQQLPAIRTLLRHLNTPRGNQFLDQFEGYESTVHKLERAIQEEPPVSTKEGNMIKPGYHSALDEWIQLAKGGKQALLALESEERQRTGIKNLKVGYNQVFGYYLEISNGQLNALKPEYGYQRRQTLTNAERFITPSLKALETKLLQAEEAQKRLEEEILLTLIQTLLPLTPGLQKLADMLAELDVLASFAYVSSQYQYVRPIIHEEKTFLIEQSRHPVIEKMMKKSAFVANDFAMDHQTNTLLITGPNMGGKSTYMRQIALMIIMAQIGCFVPAKQASLMLVDAIYTRIGASDDLVGGQSTFMMEMTQTQYALQHATDRSFLVFDEIGRGTATFDGMALAQAIIEYVTQTIQAKTLFSTHYHELTHLEHSLPTLKNIHVTVHEQDEHITFLYQVKPGSMSQSFGIHVAQLASLPPSLIHRARKILTTLEDQPQKQAHASSIPLATESKIEARLKALDPLRLTPLEALQYLLDLKKDLS